MDTIYLDIFYFLCFSDHSVSTYLFSLSFPSCCSGWTLYIQSFSISSATRITVCLLIYFPFLLLPAVLDGHYMSSPFLSSLLLGSQCVYLFIFAFLYFLLFWMDTIYPVIFYFLCCSDHSLSTDSFSLSLTSCCSGWTLYIQSFSIFSATRNTVCLVIYFHLLSNLLFRMETLYPVILYFLCYSDRCVSTYLFSLSLTSCCSGRTLYIQSFSISSATRITVSLLIFFSFPFLPAILDGHYISRHFLFPLLLRSQCVYLFIFPFFFLPAVLDGHYISSRFLFPLLLRSQCVYLFIFPFLSFLLFWMDTIYLDISYFLCYSDQSVSTYLFSLSFLSCCSGWTLYIQPFFYFLCYSDHSVRSQCVYLFIFPFLCFLQYLMDAICPVLFYHLCYSDHSVSTYLFFLSLTSCCSGWTLNIQ